MRKLFLPVAVAAGLMGCSEVASTPNASKPPRLAATVPTRTIVQPIPGRYIIRFKDTERDVPGRGRSIEQQYGAKVERTYVSAIKGVAVQLSDAEAPTVARDANVQSIEQDQTVTLSFTQTNATWGLDRIDQRNLPLSTTYSYVPDGSGVTVYIIDTGINFTHTEYAGRAFTGIDEVTSGGSAVDCNGHGSHVSGTVGGTTYGVAKNVRLIAVRVLDCTGSGTVSGVIAGIDWVATNRTLPAAANMSLGGAFSSALNAAVTNAIGTGVVFGVAAGNSAGNACNESPSSTPDAITVGATDITDTFASFSNFGTCVDINAPGVSITSAWIGSNTATNTISGTSMATPHLVGTAALYLQTNPTATPAQVATAITTNATAGVIKSLPANTANLLVYTGFVSPPPLPVASFTASCPQLTCSFNASGTVSAWPSPSFSWTFGDGTAGSGKTPSHTYAAAGTYSVTLTVADPNGANSKTSSVTTGSGVPNQPPTALISAPNNNASFAQGVAVSFSGSANDPEDGALTGASLVWTSSIDGQIGAGTSFSKSNLSVGTHTITLTATDSQGATGTDTRTITITVASGPNQPPTVSFLQPTLAARDFNAGQPVTFVGSAQDPEDGTLTGASLVWTSKLVGQIGTGTTFTISTLPVGANFVTLTATDSKGAKSSYSRTVNIHAVTTNQPPTAGITAPANNSSFPQGMSVGFAGTGSDPEDGTLTGASLVWTSSINGQIGTGTSFSTTTLSAGTHTITLTAKDSQGATGTATITLTIVAPNQPPTAGISAPANNSSFPQGTSVGFAGTGSDPEDGTLTGASLVWTSSINGQIGTGTSFSTTSLSVGSHTITLTATDSKGAKGAANVSITITPSGTNTPPTATIANPSSNTFFNLGKPITFTGSGNDAQDGPLSGASLVWTSSINGQIGTGTSFSTSALSAGTHTITLTAKDSQGATGTATLTITVNAVNSPPVASFIQPTLAARDFNFGQTVTFIGSGTDQEDGTLTGGSLVWTSSISGQIGTGTTFSISTLPVGNHFVTLTVTDSQGAKSSYSRTIRIH